MTVGVELLVGSGYASGLARLSRLGGYHERVAMGEGVGAMG